MGGVQTGFPEMVDVTEDVLDALLKALEKRREVVYKNAFIKSKKGF